MSPRLGLAVIVAVLLAGCDKGTPTSSTSGSTQAGSTAGVPASAASAQATAAPAAASGPIIPPEPVALPTAEQRQAGATLASQGGGGAVAACSGCHGANGEGNPATGFPRIAGQPHLYLVRQLDSYANDTRAHPVMAPIAKAMTPPQRMAAAAYYASLGASAPAATAAAVASSPGTNSVSSSGTRQAGAAGNDRGRQLAMWGDEGKVVQACANCHGPEGTGEGREFPYLAGQSAAYLTAALTAWRDGSRRSDPSGQMPLIAKSLADADVQAVAAYYAGLPAPSAPLDAAAPPAAPASGATTVVSGPRPGAQAPQGVGTQQGSLTGGVQGPGGGGAGTGGGPGGSTTGESAVAPASGASR